MQATIIKTPILMYRSRQKFIQSWRFCITVLVLVDLPNWCLCHYSIKMNSMLLNFVLVLWKQRTDIPIALFSSRDPARLWRIALFPVQSYGCNRGGNSTHLALTIHICNLILSHPKLTRFLQVHFCVIRNEFKELVYFFYRDIFWPICSSFWLILENANSATSS